MKHRLPARLGVFAKVLARIWRHPWRKPPGNPQRILLAHHLLLGDTLMLTPLLAQLRQQYPRAEIHMTLQKALAGLYSGKPYGVTALPFDPRDVHSQRKLFNQQPYDLAFVPGDNRYSWLAYAMGARWIIAFAGDRPAYKSWLIDELRTYPNQPMAWPDMNRLLSIGDTPTGFTANDWPAPEAGPIQPLPEHYVVLHVGASSPLKLWPFERWWQLAGYVHQRGLDVVWSGGPGEEKYIRTIDPDNQYYNYAGRLNLAQMWHLLKNAVGLVCPDTGVAHLARITQTPTVCLFGPGSMEIHGQSSFWPQKNYRPLSADMACRNQPYLFKRELAWVKRCGRSTAECTHPKCMDALSFEQVVECFDALIR